MNDPDAVTPASTGPTVMVVEDEQLTATSLEIVLQNRSYRVLGPVPTVGEALALLETTRPDLALIDYRLTSNNTAVLLSKLQQRRIPVCLLTGDGAHQPPSADGGLAVLQEPFRLDVLMAALDGLKAA